MGEFMGIFDKFNKKPDENINNDKSSKSNDTKGFKYLNMLIHSGVKEISLDCDIEVKSEWFNNEEVIYRRGVILDVDDLVIDGNGHTIDAKGKIRIFACTGKNVTIKNITLKNGFTKPDGPSNIEYGNGGAIYVRGGSLNIYNSILSNNFASHYGGAISGGVLNIADCTFSNNVSEMNGGAIGAGGILDIVGSTFSNNRSDYGGAISLVNCDFNIERCTFSNNVSGRDGGAISDSGPNPYAPVSIIRNNVFSIKESVFKNNSAKNTGGAIVSRNMINIHDSKIINNIADTKEIIFCDGNVKIFNCIFSNNKAFNDIIRNSDALEIYGSEFKDNKSKNIILNQSQLSIFSCQYLGNDVDGAVIDNPWAHRCTVEGSIFENNLSKNDSKNIINSGELTLTNPKIKDEGKTIRNNGSILIKDSFPDLFTKIDGGKVENLDDRIPKMKKFDFGYLDKKIHESDTKEIILEEDISFEAYESDFYEGGIELDIDGLTIDGNGKTIDGGGESRIFIVTGKNITLKNITFKSGHSHKNYDNMLNSSGGALRITSNADLIIKNCKIQNNYSEESGGAICNRGELNIYKSKLSNNQSNTDGGCIYNIWAALSIEKSILANNASKQGSRITGGAIYNEHGTLNISKSTLLGNSATSGGAIYNDFGQLDILGSVISRNTASSGFGVIYNKEGDMSITKSTISNNKIGSSDDGSAIFSVDKGNNKLFKFVMNTIGTRSVSSGRYFSADEIENDVSNGINLKDCTFKNNEGHDFGRSSIDFKALNEYSSQLGYSIYDRVIRNKKG